MMNRVAVPPSEIGRKRDDAGDDAEKVIPALIFEERAVSGIVQDDEAAHSKHRRDESQEQRHGIERQFKTAVSYVPHNEKRRNTRKYSDDAATCI